MIIFGTRGKQIDGEFIENAQCPSCNQTGMHSIGLIRYFHVYWIPMFVFRRDPALACPHCKLVMDKTDLDPPVRTELKQIVFAKRSLWGYNFGVIVIAGLMGLSFVSAAIQGLVAARSGSQASQSTAPSMPASSGDSVPATTRDPGPTAAPAPAAMLPTFPPPKYTPLIGDGLSGSGFHFTYRGRQFIACSLHQFDDGVPKVMAHFDFEDPITILGRICKQTDVQVLAFKSEALSKIPALDYDPITSVEMKTPVYVYAEDKTYLGTVARPPGKTPLYYLQMSQLYPAAGMSGSPVVSGLTGKVIGVVLTADSPDEARLVGFELLREPGLAARAPAK